MYKIVAKSRYGVEIVDQAGTLNKAYYLVSEYQMAFGPEFQILIRKNGKYI